MKSHSDFAVGWLARSLGTREGVSPQRSITERATPPASRQSPAKSECNFERILGRFLCLLRALPSITIFALAAAPAHAAKVIVIGDSLSAEYEAIPDVPGTENPTEYARVTLNNWEAMSWVEVLARLRPADFDFGRFKPELLGWQDLRFSGYEFNFAIPGFRAAQYEEIVTSSIFSDPFYIPFRLTLADALKGADAAVVWLGGNEFRANYGFLAGGGNPGPLIAQLMEDLKAIIDFVQQQNPNSTLVVPNIPDLSAAPDKRKAHPDPVERARVTAATRQANAAIADLAASEEFIVADAFSLTERLMDGVSTFFGAVEIIDATHPDNHPRYHFTREGLHPNTPSQIEIARIIIDAFNRAGTNAIPQITDSEALTFLGLDPHLPYHDWTDTWQLAQAGMPDDPDHDGLPNLAEMALDLDPTAPNHSPISVTSKSGPVEIAFTLNPKATRLVQVLPQYSTNLATWIDLPIPEPGPEGRVEMALQPSAPAGFVRLRVVLLPLE